MSLARRRARADRRRSFAIAHQRNRAAWWRNNRNLDLDSSSWLVELAPADVDQAAEQLADACDGPLAVFVADESSFRCTRCAWIGWPSRTVDPSSGRVLETLPHPREPFVRHNHS